MRQYFIKIKQSSEQLSFGELVEGKKNKQVLLAYLKSNNKPVLSNPLNALEWIKDENNNPQSKIVFFIHGLVGSRPFVLSRNSNVFRVDYSANKDITFVHILWNNEKIRYSKSLEILRSDIPVLANLLNTINKVFSNTSLMCQSMGNRFFFETILAQKVNIAFKEILLIAPDLGVTTFEIHHEELLNFTDKVFVFYHLNDRVLKQSSRINKTNRLGQVNLELSTNNITFIECTHTEIKKFPDTILKHMYFLTSPQIKKQINDLLK